jgi:hypothetical protein
MICIGASRTARDRRNRRRIMVAIFFSASALRHWRPAFARMNLELTAGLAGIGLLTAIYHPIVPVMLVAHPRVGCEVGINKVCGNLDLGFLERQH